MNILGIDPGTQKMGYGSLSLSQLSQKASWRVQEFGTVKLPASAALTARNHMIFLEVKGLILRTSATALVVETQFVGINVQSTITLSMARAIVMLAATELGVPVFTYGPTEVKQAVTGKGNASKQQVQWMVQRRLGLKEAPDEDAADALALVLCYCQAIESKCSLPKQS